MAIAGYLEPWEENGVVWWVAGREGGEDEGKGFLLLPPASPVTFQEIDRKKDESKSG